MSNTGSNFEEELSKEFGIKRVPGSGNQFHSKLDAHGKGARWSLKATKNKSISIEQKTIDEAVDACFGLNGDGSIPVWAFRIGSDEYDLVLLRKEDFIALQRGELNIINEEKGKERVNERRRKASLPALLRDGD